VENREERLGGESQGGRGGIDRLTVEFFEGALNSAGAAAAGHADVEFIVVVRHG